MPTLNLKKKAIASPAAIEASDTHLNQIIEEVEQTLVRMNIPAIARPDIELPEDINQRLNNPDMVPMTELARLHFLYTSYAGYANYERAKMNMMKLSAKRRLEKLKLELTLDLQSKSIPKTDIPNLVKDNPLYAEQEHAYDRTNYLTNILETVYKDYDDIAASISRIVTIRTTEMNSVGRDNGIYNRGKTKAPGTPSGFGAIKK